MALSYKDVAEILKIIDASECEEVILEMEGVKLTVRRGGGVIPGPAPVESSPVKSTAPASPAPSPTAGVPPAPELKTVEAEGETVRAPMVGTFYRSPSPDKPPFVEVGSSVAVGDPVCLIEVMKLYTTIESTVGGTIVRIAADDGEMVEFDQPLFVIDPS